MCIFRDLFIMFGATEKCEIMTDWILVRIQIDASDKWSKWNKTDVIANTTLNNQFSVRARAFEEKKQFQYSNETSSVLYGGDAVELFDVEDVVDDARRRWTWMHKHFVIVDKFL